MIKEIVVFDLRKIQVLSFGDNKITDVGFNLLFTDRKWPVLIELFLRNFILIKKKTTKSKISIHLKVYKPFKHFLYVSFFLLDRSKRTITEKLRLPLLIYMGSSKESSCIM